MNASGKKRRTVRCGYVRVCYLADSLECFGYKTDCVLYQKSNGEQYSSDTFDLAMNDLITTTRARHLKASAK